VYHSLNVVQHRTPEWEWTSVAGEEREGPVAEFCAGLRQLQQASGLDRAVVARRVGYSRSQLYEILDGRIRRPPEWDRLVEPLVRVCTGDDKRAVAYWRRRHDVLVAVYDELTRQDRQDRPDESPRTRGQARVVGAAQVVPAQLPADVDVFTGRAQELAELDRLLTATPLPGPVRQICGGSGFDVGGDLRGVGHRGGGQDRAGAAVAHRVRGEFPDGQLYVNLRGYDPDQPVSPADALARFCARWAWPGSTFLPRSTNAPAPIGACWTGGGCWGAGQRGKCRAGPPPAARHPANPGGGDQPRLARRVGGP